MVVSCWWTSITVLSVAMAICNFCLLWARTVDEVGDNNNNELDDGVILDRRLGTTYSGQVSPL